MEFVEKLAILSDAAKYDASCASSGAPKRSALQDGKGGSKAMGSTTSMGICHSYTPDGRCVSLLKILLTNFCIYDCLYCVNRHSSNVARARFSVDEVVNLTVEFYKRNYIEGLFLSSGIIRSPDYTMESLVRVAKTLREQHHFQGYIHLKTIPDADEAILAQAGRYADRLSINIELPRISTLKALAPEKNLPAIGQSMGVLHEHIAASQAERNAAKKIPVAMLSAPTESGVVSKPKKQRRRSYKPPIYAPSGQSTQMIVGADNSNDQHILTTSNRLYQRFKMRRVYYSAFSPIPDSSSKLPLVAPPLLREHRLYQADWLMRFYNFDVSELVSSVEQPMLDLELDPKLNWALRHVDQFPIDINTASREQLLRVPGFGPRTVSRILQGRRFRKIGLDDLQRMRVSLDKVRHFVCARGHVPRAKHLESDGFRQYFVKPNNEQLALF